MRTWHDKNIFFIINIVSIWLYSSSDVYKHTRLIYGK